jgi:hypothetical protein
MNFIIMKKKYFLFAFLLTSLVGLAQNVTITKIIETDCPDPYLKSIELYVDGTVDFSTNVVLNYMQNAAPWANTQIDVSSFGVQSNKFIYIVRDLDLMKAEFPSTTFDTSNTILDGGFATNGDDGYQVVLNGTVVSQFGKTETDADDDTIWEHDDSVVSRKSGVIDLGTWDETHWEYSGKNSIDGLTKCQGGNGVEAFLTGLGGTYPLGSGAGWTPTAATCTTVLASTNATCNTTVAGATDDMYTATIAFSGGNTGKTFVIISSAGTVSGDNPGTDETGTITISDIPEGTNITVTVSDSTNGGVCNLSTTIESPACVPLIINEVLFDPASDDAATTDVVEGDANGDGARDAAQDEFIEFYNNSNADLDISGYTISDGSQLRHTFPAVTIIPANKFLVVFGGGTPTGAFGGAIVQTASEGANPELNLNNAGDVITIRNAANAIALAYNSASTGISHGDDQSVTRSPDVTGNFVLHTTANASLFFSPGLKVDGAALSTEQNILGDVRFYPNPVNKNSGSFVKISSNSSEKITAKIYSVIGKMIKNISVNNNQIDITSLSTGLYLVKITQDNKSITKKLLIE